MQVYRDFVDSKTCRFRLIRFREDTYTLHERPFHFPSVTICIHEWSAGHLEAVFEFKVHLWPSQTCFEFVVS